MARNPRPIPVHDVRRLSIREIVYMWMREIDIHPLTLERELRRFLLNFHLDWRAGERIDSDKPDADLPGLETLVERDWVAMFCEKKGWQLPTFWFPPDPEEVRQPGRPSHMPAIVQELERRAEAGELEDTVTQQARELNDWAVNRGLGYPRLKDKSICDKIRRKYREIREER